MNNLNSLIIEGNLAKDPDFREPTKDFKVCSFSVAVNRWYKTKKGTGEEEVSFFDVETYGKMAEICNKRLKKGHGVRVVGRLKQDRWEDKETGKLKSSIYVIAEHVEFKPVFQNDEKAAEKTTEKSAEKPVETSSEGPEETSEGSQTMIQEKQPVAVPQTQEAVF